MTARQSGTVSRFSLLGWTDSFAETLLLRGLDSLRRGELALIDGSSRRTFGTPGELNAEIRVNRRRFYSRILRGGSLAAADAWLDGDWDCEDLPSLFRIILANRDFSRSVGNSWTSLLNFPAWLWHRLRPNTRSGSRRNISDHYDLGNDFFALMLDETWAYSSGIFLSPASSLRESSVEKIDRACRKLALSPEDHLLEIGTGWGGMAEHAALRYGCRVTSVTISQEQYDFANRRIDAAGLSDRVQILLRDYRDLQGKFDKLVSIEMIEAVGHRFLGEFFERCSRLLSDRGSLLIQGILMSEQDHAQYLGSVDFIQKYVFPGGCLPAVRTIAGAVADRSDLRWIHYEDFGSHYARTLREWRNRFLENLDRVRSLGYPERFIRLWMYYLGYCEAAFEERYIGVAQILFDKPGCRRDPLESGLAAARTAFQPLAENSDPALRLTHAC